MALFLLKTIKLVHWPLARNREGDTKTDRQNKFCMREANRTSEKEIGQVR